MFNMYYVKHMLRKYKTNSLYQQKDVLKPKIKIFPKFINNLFSKQLELNILYQVFFRLRKEVKFFDKLSEYFVCHMLSS